MTDIKDTLDGLAARYNVPSFADSDPVQFPRQFDDLRDIEITAFLVSIISWGRRAMILRDSERLLQLLDRQPYNFVAGGDIESIPDSNIHRTFFGDLSAPICRANASSDPWLRYISRSPRRA